MAVEPKNLPPASPAASVTRPPPDSTDAQRDTALQSIRQARAALPGAAPFDPNAPQQTVAVMVNNGDYGGFRAIGRFFPNGLSTDVSVTEAELKELRAEPQDIIKVVSAEDVSRLQGKSASGSLAPVLSDEEQKVLTAFRSSGQDSASFLAPPPATGTGTKPDAGTEPSPASSDAHPTKRSK